jgi:hypothetical protein
LSSYVRDADAFTDSNCSPVEGSVAEGKPGMKRREVISLLGGAAALPMLSSLDARAQQAAMPVIGLLNSTSPHGFTERLRKISQGLKEQGFVEGDSCRRRQRTPARASRRSIVQRDRTATLTSE